ncbi:MAG: hypothetical protein HQL66_12850, partial [Magnetococcales bacterium]|nr:hypothetical protein [Magnetococcales bacterium]
MRARLQNLSVKFYVLLLIGIILLLSGSLTYYLHTRNELFSQEVAVISHFHIASINLCDRIDDELQSIRAHHAEEHLRTIAPGEVDQLPRHRMDHVQVLRTLYDKLGALRETYASSASRHPELAHHQASVARLLEKMETTWEKVR